LSKIKVLIVDDSIFMRKVLSDMLCSDSKITVVGTASNGLEALKEIEKLKPDVVTMDIEMPKMDGLTALEHIMRDNPLPVIMVSTLTQEGSDAAARALLLGAVDVVPKPANLPHMNLRKIKEDLISKVKAVACSSLKKTKRIKSKIKTGVVKAGSLSKGKVVLIGASTGGPSALLEVLSGLPKDFPVPVAIVQHMPDGPFIKSLAERLDSMSQIRVKEAHVNNLLESGLALLAPGGFHMLIEKKGVVKFSRGPLINGVRPSVDVMMNSAVSVYGENTIGVILTGMGKDGAEAMALIKKKGGCTIVEDESSCVVYGMPKAVVDMGNADVVASLSDIPGEIVKMLER